MLRIPKALLKKLIDHCRDEFPNEACGLIAGVKINGDLYAKKVYPLRNIAASPVMYRAHAEDLYKAMVNAEKSKVEILGIYHSHPFGQAKPSEIDRKMAYYPGLVYLIISFGKDDVRVKPYLWSGRDFIEQSFILEEK